MPKQSNQSSLDCSRHETNGKAACRSAKPRSVLRTKYGKRIDRIISSVAEDHREEEELLKAVREESKAMRKTVQPSTPADEGWIKAAIMLTRLVEEALPPTFPLHVFPPFIRRYIAACAESIHCPPDLLAIPLLSVAGAAIGRSGRRLKVKDGWTTTSCLWTAVLATSASGKTPALSAVESFYNERQKAEVLRYEQAKEAYENDPKSNEKPGPYPALKLTDTTIEALRTNLKAGPVLFSRDELGGWCHQMGQYKSGNSDRFDWCSFWSHQDVQVTRKGSDPVYVESPFVAVTGMMVPASARELNYRGQADDGFVHRILLACPETMPPVATQNGVPNKLTLTYKRNMARLFDPPATGGEVLSFEPEASQMILDWANWEHFAELRPISRPGYEPPPWLVSKYLKLRENCYRLCLVLHELWRIAGPNPGREDWEPRPRDFYGKWIEFQDGVVDRITAERAIAVVNYFKAHIGAVQSLLGEEIDEIDRQYHRLRSVGEISKRQLIHRTTWKSSDRVLAVFSEWEKRGYGKIERRKKNQVVFCFANESEAG